MEEKNGTCDLFGGEAPLPPKTINTIKFSMSKTLGTQTLHATAFYAQLSEQLPFTFDAHFDVQFDVRFCQPSLADQDKPTDATFARHQFTSACHFTNVFYFADAVQNKEKLERLLALQLIVNHAKSLTW